ncbi:MAG TPA: metal ABC transporter ATP-binding protein [Candidatus Saccharimonadales bacterium]|nr:metal ABC transporter ATP-binding protein [Candidatus Saccharimonadales bacterium]
MASTAVEPVIELQDVSFCYPGSEPALAGLNLRVMPGEYVGVIGPNGGGKTTLMKLLLGLLAPQTGTITLFGTPRDKFRGWHRIGYVPQRFGSGDFKLPVTVAEVVGFGAPRGDKSRVAESLAQVGMEVYARRRLRELSGGQQQRVFIAKALASRPEILILDEPTAGVDVHAQDGFYQLLAALNKAHGLTIILVSHDIDVVVNEVSKLACINEALVYHGHPKDFIEKDYLTKLYGKTRKFILHGH